MNAPDSYFWRNDRRVCKCATGCAPGGRAPVLRGADFHGDRRSAATRDCLPNLTHTVCCVLRQRNCFAPSQRGIGTRALSHTRTWSSRELLAGDVALSAGLDLILTRQALLWATSRGSSLSPDRAEPPVIRHRESDSDSDLCGCFRAVQALAKLSKRYMTARQA